MHAESQFWAAKINLWHPQYLFWLYAKSIFSMDEKEAEKNFHLEMRNLKQAER